MILIDLGWFWISASKWVSWEKPEPPTNTGETNHPCFDPPVLFSRIHTRSTQDYVKRFAQQISASTYKQSCCGTNKMCGARQHKNDGAVKLTGNHKIRENHERGLHRYFPQFQASKSACCCLFFYCCLTTVFPPPSFFPALVSQLFLSAKG